MNIFVSGRQGGKTKALIEWMLQGKPIDHYPYWSRVIICPTKESVVYMTNRLWQATRHMGDVREVYDIRKAVWSLNDLTTSKKHHGTRDLEFGVDDAELVIAQILNQPLSFITLTGELVHNENGTGI